MASEELQRVVLRAIKRLQDPGELPADAAKVTAEIYRMQVESLAEVPKTVN